MKIYCEDLRGKRFTIQGSEEGNTVIVKVGGRVFRLPKDDLERGLSVIMTQDYIFEKYSPIEHDSKLRGKQNW